MILLAVVAAVVLAACVTPDPSDRRLVLFSGQVDQATAISQLEASPSVSLGSLEADSASRLRIHVRLSPGRLAAGSRVELTSDEGRFEGADAESPGTLTVEVFGDSATAILIAGGRTGEATLSARFRGLVGFASVDLRAAWPDTILLWPSRASVEATGEDTVTLRATLPRSVGRVSDGLLIRFVSTPGDLSGSVVVSDGRSAELHVTSREEGEVSWVAEMGAGGDAKRSAPRAVEFREPEPPEG